MVMSAMVSQTVPNNTLVQGSSSGNIAALAGANYVTTSGAPVLVNQFNYIKTCATAGDSVILPSATPGLSLDVYNDGAAIAAIFCQSGDSINDGVSGGYIGLRANNFCSFYCNAPGLWQVSTGVPNTVHKPSGFTGTLIYGDGGTNLSHVSSNDGYYNTFIGIGSGNNCTTGYNNSATGLQSLYSCTTGYNNSAFGNNSLYSNTTGYGNSAMGLQSLYYCTTGYNNTAYGNNSLLNVTTGFLNTVIGVGSGAGITIGSNNTIVGANVSSLPSGLTGNIILASGDGGIKAQYDGSAWNLAGFINETSKSVAATDSLTTYTISARNTYLTGTAGASFAVTLPAAAAAIDGQKIVVMSTATRASTTWASSGATGGIIGAPSTLTANTPVMLQYDHASLAWYITL